MRIQDILIGLMVFAVFTLTILGFVYTTYDRMGVEMDGNTSQVFRSFELQANSTGSDMFGLTRDMQNKSPGGEGVTQDTSKTFSDNIFASGWAVINLIPRVYPILQGTMEVLGNSLDVDSMFIGLFMSMLVVTIVMIFVSSVLYNRL